MRFGICDRDDKSPAFLNIDHSEKWIATVVNASPPKTIQFTAIDNCIDICRDNGEMESRCDAMLQYEDRLVFVELKTKRADWKSEGLGQIEATVKRMLLEIPEYYFGFKKRKAIVANSKHPSPAFHGSDKEIREIFKRQYRMHLQFEAEITLE